MTDAARKRLERSRKKAALVHIDTFVPEAAAPAIWQAIDDIVGRIAQETEERERLAAMPAREQLRQAARAWQGVIWGERNKTP